MKKLFFKGIAAAAACVMMFTSCLDEGSGEQNFYSFGVIKTESTTYRTLLYPLSSYYPVYSSTLDAELGSESPVYASIIYNTKDEVNANVEAKGYYTGTVQYNKLSTGYLYESTTDTEREPVANEEIFSSIAGVYYMDWLFIDMAYPTYQKDQENRYILTYDPEDVENKVYNLYLQVTKTKEGSDKSENVSDVIGIKSSEFVRQVKNSDNVQDSNQGYKFVQAKINYASGFNSDSTEVNWKKSETIIFAFTD